MAVDDEAIRRARINFDLEAAVFWAVAGAWGANFIAAGDFAAERYR